MNTNCRERQIHVHAVFGAPGNMAQKRRENLMILVNEVYDGFLNGVMIGGDDWKL